LVWSHLKTSQIKVGIGSPRTCLLIFRSLKIMIKIHVKWQDLMVQLVMCSTDRRFTQVNADLQVLADGSINLQHSFSWMEISILLSTIKTESKPIIHISHSNSSSWLIQLWRRQMTPVDSTTNSLKEEEQRSLPILFCTQYTPWTHQALKFQKTGSKLAQLKVRQHSLRVFGEMRDSSSSMLVRTLTLTTCQMVSE
jgi:hypothetical protein